MSTHDRCVTSENDLPRTRDFARIANRYDESRNLPFDILLECYQRLEDQGLLHRGEHVLDAGCGTGQLSLPLITRGYQVTGVDFAEAMLERFRAKITDTNRVTLLTADARRLPVDTNSIDVAVSSKLLMHVPRWELAVAEIIRVVRPKGRFFHIYERGAFVNTIRARFTTVCDALGYRNRHLGLQREEDLSKYLLSLGAQRISVSGPALKWSKSVTFRGAIEGFEERLFGEFWA